MKNVLIWCAIDRISNKIGGNQMVLKAVEAKTNNEAVFETAKTFSSFSVNDLKAAKEFYSQTLGLKRNEQPEGLGINFDGGQSVFLYEKSDHQPATFTVLNFPVDDIQAAVDGLAARGVTFESYGDDIPTDEKGIFRGKKSGHGPDIAWFKDPAGNILSVIEE